MSTGRDHIPALIAGMPLDRSIRFAISDPGAFLPRGDYSELITHWSGRAVMAVVDLELAKRDDEIKRLKAELAEEIRWRGERGDEHARELEHREKTIERWRARAKPAEAALAQLSEYAQTLTAGSEGSTSRTVGVGLLALLDQAGVSRPSPSTPEETR